MVGRSRVRAIIVGSVQAAGVLGVCLSWCGAAAETAFGQGIRRSGSPQYHYVAQNTTPAAPQSEESVLKAYPYRAGDVATMAAQLSGQFRDRPDIRVVLDERTSQILVMAPPAIQTQIEALIQAGPRSVVPPITPPPSPTATPGRQPAARQPAVPMQGTRSRSVALEHITTQQLNADLGRMLGDRLVETRAAQADVRSYQLSLPHGTTIQLAVDEKTNRVHIQGTQADADACVRLIEALDADKPAAGGATRVMTLESASPEAVRRAIGAIQTGDAPAGQSGRMVSMLFPQGEREEPQPPSPSAEAPGAVAPDAGSPGVEIPQREGSLIGPVQIEMLEGLDVLVVRGHQRDVEQVMKIIEDIENLSVETEPSVEVYPLQHTNSSSLAALLAPLYEEVFSPRQGAVSITSLVKPNALLLVGRPESVQTVIELVKKLDQPVAPETQFRVFRLKHASAWNAQTTFEEFFGGEDAGDFGDEEPGLKTRVLATADYRSNSLIVRASPRDMVEVEALIERIDTPDSDAINELRVFKLENSIAEDLEPILQQAINDETSGMMGGRGGAGGIGSTPQGAAAGGGRGGIGGSSMIEQKATMLTFRTVDHTGQREIT